MVAILRVMRLLAVVSNDGDTIEGEVPGGDIDAAALVGEGDSSHNRHSEPEHKIEGEDVAEVSAAILEALEDCDIKGALADKIVIKLTQCKSARDVFEVLKSEALAPDKIAEATHFIAKRMGWHEVAEVAEAAAPAAAGAMLGLEFAELSMKYIIGPANEKGRQSGQLNRYAAAWASRFLDDGYNPEMLAELDEQMALMNTCSRLGVEDAVKTLAKLGKKAESTRRDLINHYHGKAQAHEQLVLELLKQAGVK